MLRQIVTVVLLGLTQATAQAGLQTITDPGSDFSITYDDAQIGMFGTPFLDNNTIFFLPNEVFAESLNGAGQVMTDGTLQLMLTATTAGFTFDSFSLFEHGNYLLDGADAVVDFQGQISAIDRNNPHSFASELIRRTGPLSNINDGSLHKWIAAADLDASSGWIGGSTAVTLTIDNVLRAATKHDFTTAYIEKKFEGVRLAVNHGAQVPVPAALWLFASALLGMSGRRRERDGS